MMGWLGIASRRGAYIALACLTLVWGLNWAAMKLGLRYADPIIFNIERTWVAIATLFVVLLLTGKRFWPESWLAVCVTGFCQTTVNFGATAMALASGGAGRTAVLVFTMPFWTLLIAWPVLGERVRGGQWLAVSCALAGLLLIVEPWDWQGDLAPKLWATVSGFGWAGGTVAQAFFQRRRRLEGLTLMTWQMVVGILPITLIPLFVSLPGAEWNVVYLGSLLYAGVIAGGIGFVLWIGILAWLPTGTAALNMLVIPVIALVSSMLVFGERLDPLEWAGIAAIGVGLAIISIRAVRAASH
jgi:drug/metabolite transporter (DMT)-like permease